MSLKKYAAALPDTYHYLAASCFCIYNRPDAIPAVFEFARKHAAGLRGHQSVEADLRIARQFREAILRAGIFGGMSKAINALQELHKAMPQELRESSVDDTRLQESVGDLQARGSQFLLDVYGQEKAAGIEQALWTLSPRLGYYSVPLVYGGIYADTSALSLKDACVLMFLCNTAVDTPKQAKGHIDSSKRHGASRDELLQAAFMANSIAQLEGIKLKHWEEIMDAADSTQASTSTPYDLE
ncbi:hypothetical protein PYCC9005_005326 [Savitreella phatthalungensis]